MRIKKIAAVLAVLGLILSLAGCGTSFRGGIGAVMGDGVITDTIVPLDGSFDRIVSQGSFDVIISNEPSDSLLFQLDENLMTYVDLNVRISGSTLYLSTQNITQSISPTVFRFHVGTTGLHAVNLTGSGSIRGDGILRADHFEAGVTGSGDVNLEVDIAGDLNAAVGGSGELVLRGSAAYVNISVSGSGTADLREVPVQNAEVRVTGSGDAHVRAAEDLRATVAGSGDIFYHGAPANVTRSVTGSGSISGR